MRRLEELLEARAAFGMHLGLERMHLLLDALENPQRRFRSVHVVGTNGKSSTARFCAAILGAHGLRAGAYLSPHVLDPAERVQLDGVPMSADTLSDAVELVERAAADVDARSSQPLTQFEVLTAAAFVALAAAGAEVVALEAGLGGRFDATNVVDADVVLLTNVALDHMAQLGDTREAIAAEKLAVVPAGATLVVGEVDAELEPTVRRLARERGAGRTELLGGDAERDLPPLRAAGRYQRRNLALALAGARHVLGSALREDVALAAAAVVSVPGRLQVVAEEPLTVFDGAHNPHGAAALAGELGPLLGGRRPVVGVLAILSDKDVDGVLDALAPAFDRVLTTDSGSERALDAEELAARARRHGLRAEPEPDPERAVARARSLAGSGGAVVAAGSLTLMAALLADQVARTSGEDGRGP